MINLTILEVEHILEAFDEIELFLNYQFGEDQYLGSITDQIRSSQEILRACVSRDRATAYKLEELDDAQVEYLSALAEEYPDTETNSNS